MKLKSVSAAAFYWNYPAVLRACTVLFGHAVIHLDTCTAKLLLQHCMISQLRITKGFYRENFGASSLCPLMCMKRRPVKQKQGVVAHSREPLVRYGTASCECGAHRWDDAGQFRSEASSRRTAATVCHQCQCTGRWVCPSTSPLGSRQPTHIRLFCDHADALIIHTLQNCLPKTVHFPKICIPNICIFQPAEPHSPWDAYYCSVRSCGDTTGRTSNLIVTGRGFKSWLGSTV